MHVDQDDIHHTAKQLHELFAELEQAKFDRPPAPEVSTTHSNRQKGPMCPGPIWALSDDAYFTERLNQMVCDAAARIDGEHKPTLDGRQLTWWVAWHAGPISQLDFADDILDELKHQIRELNHKLRRTRPPEPIDKPQEVWLTARTICYKLRQQGHNVSPELLRKWAERGRVHTRKAPSGVNVYSLKGVLNLVRSN